MKKSYIVLIILTIMSFYVSDKAILYIENLNPLMKEIKYKSDNLNSLPVNAIIEGNTIIPGVNGKSINIRESFLKMNEFGAFNETFYVYDYIKPDISLNDNLDKIIVKGNKLDSVSIIYNGNLDINHTSLISNTNEINNNNFINISSEEIDFKNINNYIKRKKLNKICLINYSNISLCRKYKYYIVKPNIELTNNNYISNVSNINGGDIIYISDDLKIEYINHLLNELKYKNYKIIDLINIISE